MELPRLEERLASWTPESDGVGEWSEALVSPDVYRLVSHY